MMIDGGRGIPASAFHNLALGRVIVTFLAGRVNVCIERHHGRNFVFLSAGKRAALRSGGAVKRVDGQVNIGWLSRCHICRANASMLAATPKRRLKRGVLVYANSSPGVPSGYRARR